MLCILQALGLVSGEASGLLMIFQFENKTFRLSDWVKSECNLVLVPGVGWTDW